MGTIRGRFLIRLPGGGFPGVTEPSVSPWQSSTPRLRGA
jgi:hypothetical protein